MLNNSTMRVNEKWTIRRLIQATRGLFIVLLLRVQSVSPVTMLTKGQLFVKSAGDSIRLDCDFRQSDYDLFRCPVLWKKSQRGEESQINIMGNINAPFLETARYRVELLEMAPRYMLQLHISELAQEDSGNYSCEMRGHQSQVLAQVTHSLFVRAPVQHIFVTSSRNLSELAPEYKTPSVISLVENEAATMRCIAVGGYPPPSIELYVGDKSISNLLRFQNSAHLHGVKGLKVMSFTSERWTTHYMPRADEDGKRLDCIVQVSDLPAQRESVELSVDYGPRIDCIDQQVLIGDRNVQLVCTIDAKPKDLTYFWVLNANDTTLGPGDVVDEYWTMTQELEDGIRQVELYLRQVRPSSFRIYKLVAENSVSLSTQDVILAKKHRPSTKPLTGPHADSTYEDEAGSRPGDKQTYHYGAYPSSSSSSSTACHAPSWLLVVVLVIQAVNAVSVEETL